MNTMISREKAMQYVQETCFAVLDAGLYLDTHPCDEKAMDYYKVQIYDGITHAISFSTLK